MTTRDVGDAVNLRHEVRDVDGVLTAATAVLTVTKPDGTTITPTVTPSSTGVYDAAFTIDAKGPWSWKWSVSGAVTDVAYGGLDARDPAPPAYATLPELKTRLGDELNVNDTELQGKLATASRDIDKDCGRRFWLDPVPTVRKFNPRGRITREGVLLIDDIGDDDGLIVEVGTVGGSTWTAVTGYETAPDNALADGEPVTGLLRPCGWWASGSTRIRITARFGWPAVPQQINEACLLRAQRLFRRKDSPEGVAGAGDMGVVRVSRWDPDYEKLIGPFVLPGIG